MRINGLNFLFALFEIISAYYYVQPNRNYIQPSSRRTVYYPVRTNCNPTRCVPQTRYKWIFRPTNVSGGPKPIITINTGIMPTRSTQPVKPLPPILPPIQPLPTQSPPIIITFSPRPSPPPISISSSLSKTVITSTTTTISIPLVTPVTPTIENFTPKPPTELPTPPPFTNDASNQSAMLFLRPTKKPIDTMKHVKSWRFNPCPDGKPMTNAYDTPVTCNYVVQPNGGCPEDYWCHTGSNFATTMCCPKINWENRCDLPRSIGEGDALVPRWYFEASTKQCKRFLYKGLKGNANNFLTSGQCMETCETEKNTVDLSNPCKNGLPARASDNTRLKCGMGSATICPSGFYCHIGEDYKTNACCENSGISDRCLLSVNVGQGRGLLKRFYYNTIAKRCIEFIYKGIKGNENNFLTYQECKDNCMRWNNPCPLLFDYGERKECSPISNLCDKGEWCHIGASKETTACCPGAISNPCKQPLEIGVGVANLTRWYSDPLDKSCRKECRSFTYKGTKGNQNNFLSKDQCENTCKPECINPCSSGDMLLEPSGSPRTCSPVSMCPSGFWCHVGTSTETTVCCTSVKNPCELPKVEGFGDARLTRWYFNKAEHKCLNFIYRGSGGNQNMFLTSEECRSVCHSFENPCGSGSPLMVNNRPKVCNPNERCPGTHFCHIGSDSMPNYCCPKNGDPCEHNVSIGEGSNALKRFYFDKQTKRCREFTYQGSKGNANNFLSQEDCELVCPVLPNPCQNGEPQLDENNEPIICGGSDACAHGYFCHIGGSPETTNCCPGTRRPCDLPLDLGAGNEHLERWYYDGSVQLCRKLYYKGMKGNANNFLSRDMCRQSCPELNPCLNGEPLIDVTGERMSCTGGQKLDSCPKSHYCHVGGSHLSTICCPKSGSEPCEQIMNNGMGGENLPRWYFNTDTNKCLQFLYGGTRGNENNFISKQTCEEICPEYRNYCPHGMPLLEMKSNKPVTCGINQNCPPGHICHMSAEFRVSICCEDPSDFCLQPRDPGPCTNFETRYGYHPLSDTCVEYEYGGCEGTLNNFKTLQRCTEICCKEYKLKRLRDVLKNNTLIKSYYIL